MPDAGKAGLPRPSRSPVSPREFWNSAFVILPVLPFPPCVHIPFLRPKESFITCRDRDDGGGAQISARISAMILARLRGLTYAHSPVAEVAHASG